VPGTIVAIHITPEGAAPMKTVKQVSAVEGKGLEGDRYFLAQGTYSGTDKPHRPDRQVTLIEAEAVEASGRDYKVKAASADIRRNLVTRGIPLNHLVGREFTVGGARLRGIRLCEPCEHMEELSGKPGIRESLVHRGGLRAEILKGGLIKVGDAVALSA
jgi:MOSC domain-containing protein YiiM